jgi:hypothetical protein
MVLVPKDEQVHVELAGPLQDGACDIVQRCTHDLAVRIDACGGQPEAIDDRAGIFRRTL